jgi:hypothetical protein
MLQSAEGIYRNGKIELLEEPQNLPEGARVIVTFLETREIDLSARGIDNETAAELREQLRPFAEDWDSPEMKVYDHYDDAKARL